MTSDVFSAIPTDSSYRDLILIPLAQVGHIPPSSNRNDLRRYGVTVRSRLSSWEIIKKLISRPDVVAFINSRIPNLAWLINFRYGQTLTYSLIDYLIQRRINSGANDRELWFNFEGMPVRFSLREFVLCSGLNVHKVYKDEDRLARMEDLSLIQTIYVGLDKKNVHRANVDVCLLEEHVLDLDKDHPYSSDAEQPCDPEVVERLTKLLIALIFGRFMFNQSHHSVMPASVIQMCNDADFCNKYDWGTECYDKLLKDMKFSKYDQKISYSMCHFPFVAMAWAYEACPQMVPALATKDKGVLPRLAAYYPIEHRISDDALVGYVPKITHIWPTLHPTAEEEHTWYWSQYMEHVTSHPPSTLFPRLTEVLGRHCVVIRSADARVMIPFDFSRCKRLNLHKVKENPNTPAQAKAPGKTNPCNNVKKTSPKAKAPKQTKGMSEGKKPTILQDENVDLPQDHETDATRLDFERPDFDVVDEEGEAWYSHFTHERMSMKRQEPIQASSDISGETNEPQPRKRARTDETVHPETSGRAPDVMEPANPSAPNLMEKLDVIVTMMTTMQSQMQHVLNEINFIKNEQLVKRKPEVSRQMSNHPSTDDNGDVGCESVQEACLQQIIAACNVLRMVEKKKGNGGGDANDDGYKLLRKSNIEQISSVANVLIAIEKEKGNEMDEVLALNRALITKERKSNNELVEAHKALVEGLPDLLIPDMGITTKRMGEIDILPFADACKKKYRAAGEANEKASELCSLWQGRLSDPSFYPFTVQTNHGMSKEVLDEEDCELKRLREEWGLQVYEAVTAALKEMNQCNPSGRYPVSVLWNSRESRKATLKELVEYMMKAMKTQACNRLHEAGPLRNRKY